MTKRQRLTNEQKQLVEEIFLKHREDFFKKAYSIVGTKEDADDAVSVAMLKIINHIDRIKMIPETQMIYFCTSIVKNTSIDLNRKKNKKSLFALEEGGVADPSEEPEQIALRNEQIREIRNLQRLLTDEERLLLHLRYGMEAEYKEIASVMGINTENAKKRGQRIIQRLRGIRMNVDQWE